MLWNNQHDILPPFKSSCRLPEAFGEPKRLAGIFVVFIMTSPDWGSNVLLCSSHVSVNKAPRGHDYSMSLHPLSASISLPLFPFPPLSIYSRNWWFNEELGHHEWPPPNHCIVIYFSPSRVRFDFSRLLKIKRQPTLLPAYFCTYCCCSAAWVWSVKPEYYQRQTGGSLEERIPACFASSPSEF